MKALILDGHSRAALETLQALGRAGVVVDICSERDDALSFISAYPRQRFKQPSVTQLAQFTAWLRDLDDRHGYDLIVPSTEASLIALNELPPDHPLRSKSVISSRESIEVALDKQATWALAARLNIPVPRCSLITGMHDAPSGISFPTVLKPIHSKIIIDQELVTLAVAVVSDANERNSYFCSWLPYTAIQEQEYFPGRGVGIELLCDHGKTLWHFAHERIHEFPLSGGASTYRRSIKPPDNMLSDAKKILETLAWHGVAMVEFKLNSDGDYRLLEINPRLWGSLALPIDAGLNFPLGLLGLATGQPPSVQPDYKVDYFSRNLFEDLLWLKENIAADRKNPLLLTRPVIKSFMELFRPAFGNESWDHFDTGDLAVTAAIIRRIFNKLTGAFLKDTRWS